MEAAVCKLPIVARDIEPFNWLIHNESCCKAYHHNEFLSGIEMLLHDSTFRNKIIKNAYALTDKLHNFKKIGDKIENLYKRAIKIKTLLRERIDN